MYMYDTILKKLEGRGLGVLNNCFPVKNIHTNKRRSVNANTKPCV